MKTDWDERTQVDIIFFTFPVAELMSAEQGGKTNKNTNKEKSDQTAY